MSDKITYEQFKSICEKWNLNTDEGFKAICFVSNVINKNLENTCVYVNNILKNDNHSDDFKTFAKKWKENAIRLSVDYASVENEIFKMLEKEESKNEA